MMTAIENCWNIKSVLFLIAYATGIILFVSHCYEPLCQKNVPSDVCTGENSDQSAHSRSLIRIFTGSIMDSNSCKVFVLFCFSCGQ